MQHVAPPISRYHLRRCHPRLSVKTNFHRIDDLQPASRPSGVYEGLRSHSVERDRRTQSASMKSRWVTFNLRFCITDDLAFESRFETSLRAGGDPKQLKWI